MRVYPSHWQIVKEHSSLPFFHPSHILFYDSINDYHFLWSQRRTRKGRSSAPREPSLKAYKYWAYNPDDISYWVAFLFTLGSLIWVLNGIFVLFYGDYVKVVSLSAFAGGMVFSVGGLAIYWEGLNMPIHQEFGKTVRVLEHQFRKVMARTEDNENVDENFIHSPQSETVHQKWRWFGMESLRDVGFSLSLMQFIGTTIFGISVIAGLPGVLPSDTSSLYYTFLFWTPQVVGAFFLTLSSFLMVLESQHVWYKPEILKLSWHVGFFNVIGSVGFFLSGLFGYWNPEPGSSLYQNGVALSTFWGSIAFLVGSYLQFIEAINK